MVEPPEAGPFRIQRARRAIQVLCKARRQLQELLPCCRKQIARVGSIPPGTDWKSVEFSRPLNGHSRGGRRVAAYGSLRTGYGRPVKTASDPVSQFLARAMAEPDRPAVVEPAATVTYEALRTRVCELAHALTSFGDHPRVLIHLPQGSWAYAAMLGTLMSGGYYGTTNLSQPRRRQQLVFERLRPDVVISDAHNVESLRPALGSTPVIDVNEPRRELLATPARPHSLAYVMFTSGTTGVPKGVMIPRSALAHF